MKLNKLLQRESEIISVNRSKKLEINHMRRMREQTETAQSKYEATMLEIKGNIEAMSSESTAIVNERERLVREKEKLERLNIEEQKMFTEQHEAMSLFIQNQNEALEIALMYERKFDKNPTGDLTLMNDDSTINDSTNKSSESITKLPKSPTVKSSKAVVAILTGSPQQTQDNLNDDILTLEEEIDIAKQVNHYAEMIRDEQISLISIQERISNYELMFSQLQKMTQCETLDEIVATYVKREDEMFSLYNYLQTLNDDIDSIIEQTEQHRNEQRTNEKHQSDLIASKHKEADELRSKYELLLESVQDLEETSRHEHQYLVQICKKIDTLFLELDCDRPENHPCFLTNIELQRSTLESSSANSGKRILSATGSDFGQSSSLPESPSQSSLNPHTLTKSPSTKFAEKQVAMLLGDGVSESNVIDYLGCIESRAVHILEQYITLLDNKSLHTHTTRENSRTTSIGSRKAISAGQTICKTASLRRSSSFGGICTPASWLVNMNKPTTTGSHSHNILSQSGTTSPPRVINIDEIYEFEQMTMNPMHADNDEHDPQFSHNTKTNTTMTTTMRSTESANSNKNTRTVVSSATRELGWTSPGFATQTILGNSNSSVYSDESTTPVDLNQYKERLFKSLLTQSQTTLRELPLLSPSQLPGNKAKSNNASLTTPTVTTRNK